MNKCKILTFFEIKEPGTYLVYRLKHSFEKMKDSPIESFLKIKDRDGKLFAQSIDGTKNVPMDEALSKDSKLSIWSKEKLYFSLFVGPLESILDIGDESVKSRYYECEKMLNELKEIQGIIE